MNRNAILKHVELWKAKLGSYREVAKKCGINVGALSTIVAGKYGANEAKMLQKIAHALDYKESNWTLVPGIGNYQTLKDVWEDAKEESMWFAVSNKAGSGKTATMEDLFNKDETGSVIFIQAEEWSGRQFLLKVIEKTLGEKEGGVAYSTTGKGYKSVTQLMEIVANYFNDMSLTRPVLLIDEADKLKPSAIRTLIPLFNRTEDRMGLILSGTENLEKEIKQGVRSNKKGYDELESRFGRTYIHLNGLVMSEVFLICQQNGINNKEVQATIWGELEKVKKPTMVKTQSGEKQMMIDFVEDFRRLKRLIKRETLKGKRAA